NKLRDVSDGIRENGLGALTVAAHPSAAISMMAPVTARFAALHPQVRLKLINRTSEEILSFFPGTGVDIAVCELNREMPGVQTRRQKLRTKVVLPLDHPLAAKPALSPADLSGVPFIAMPTERLISHQVRLAFDEGGACYNPIAEVDFFASICVMVAQGLGVSLVDAFSARHFAPLGLTVRPFTPEIPYEVAILSMPNRPQSVLVDTFLGLLEDHLVTEGL
ncbi:LysR substrate-binding domain-containing protein, partial [Haematobacter genomosp. 1]